MDVPEHQRILSKFSRQENGKKVIYGNKKRGSTAVGAFFFFVWHGTLSVKGAISDVVTPGLPEMLGVYV